MKKLTKSATDRQLSGVLGGIAEYLGIDSTLVRIVFLVFVFLGVGSPVFLYIILAMIMPEPKRNNNGPYDRRGRDYQSRPRKEAKPVEKESDHDDWSDF